MPKPPAALQRLIQHETAALARTPQFNLWAEVLVLAWHDATHHLDVAAIQFFRHKNGIFHDICELTNLPEDAIRQRLDKVVSEQQKQRHTYAKRYRRRTTKEIIRPASPAPSTTPQPQWRTTWN